MEEVLRNYTWGGHLRRRRRELRRRTRGFLRMTLPVLIPLVIAALWFTRDSHDLSEFIGRDQAFELYINDVVGRRADILDSRVWELIPPSSAWRPVLDRIATEPPLPEWLLNNLSSGVCHASGPGIDRIQETLVLTHMTRIGCLAEFVFRFLPGVDSDPAGGLGLRHLRDASLYYATRGRILLISPSRDRLIHALTLHPDSRLDLKEIESGTHNATGADVYCRIDAEAWAVDGNPVADIDLALRLEPQAARLAIHARLTPAWQERLAPLLSPLEPATLARPLDGMLTLSANVGQPFPQFLKALHEVLQQPDALTPLIALLENGESSFLQVADLQDLLLGALNASGENMRLAWYGLDTLEMLPAPLVAAVFDADVDAILALFEHIAPPPEVPESIDWVPRWDEDLMLAHVPLIGGLSIEPTVALYHEGLLISSSLTLAQELRSSPVLADTYSQHGNLYLAAKPDMITATLAESGRELAAAGLLRNHTPESFEAVAAAWTEITQPVQEIALLAGHENGEARMEIKLIMKPDGEAAPPAPESPPA